MPNTYGQGSTRAWRKVRTQVLARDKHQCQLRYADICTTVATQVDHVTNIASTRTPRREAINPNDCQAVCQPCHEEKTKRERCQGKRGQPTRRNHPGLTKPT